MTQSYSWRDGWALTYPYPILKKPTTESVTRCTYCGAWRIVSAACLTCGTEGTNDNNT